MRVQPGDNVGIGGFIITGTAPKHVLLRAIGPSLSPGVPDALADPVLELHGTGGFSTITDDNWRDDPAQETAIIATGIPPTNDLESAIDATLNPGSLHRHRPRQEQQFRRWLDRSVRPQSGRSGEAGKYQHARFCQHG